MAVDSTSAAAATSASSNAAFDAAITAELSALAADAEALQAQITVGDVVLAQVLPSNGLTDLVSILGNRVAAALPAGLTPGDLVTVQVTGFNGPQILMQIVSNEAPGGAVASGSPATETPPGAAPSPASPGAVTASGSAGSASGGAAAGAAAGPPVAADVAGAPSSPPAPSPSALAAAAANPLGAPNPPPRLAPPVAVFVAASVRPAPAAGSGDPAAGGTPSDVPVTGQTVAPGTSAASVAAIETRLAVARAGTAAATVAGKPVAASAVPSPGAPPPISRGFHPPPIVTPARPGNPGAAPAETAEGATPAARASLAAPPATLATFTDPTALVRALRLPVTPTNIAAAQLALTTPQRLPAALATLERALPEIDDPRVQTLRTIAAFLGKIEPSSPELAGQIAGYVDHVVDGGDAKLVQLLAAQNAAADTESTVPVVAQAQAVERAAAMASDLKTQLQQLLAGPPGGASEDLVPAAATALAAVTGVQLASAQAALAVPQQISFALPLWLGNGYTQARVAIDRDGPGAQRTPLDGDNFHIAFVLDTKNLGTVTVDLVTAGRAFSLAVKTESSSTAKRFGDALDRLTSRLETLRYTVHSAEATVAAPFMPDIGPPPPVADDDDSPATVNLRA